MKKRIILALFSLLMIMTITMVSCIRIELPSSDYSHVYDMEAASMQLNSDGEFEILQVTDTHFVGGGNKDDKETLIQLDKIIKDGTYDLVVLTGDVFDGITNRSYNKPDAMTKLNTLFTDNEQSFTYVSGNNDGEILGSDKDIVLNLLTNPYFVFNDNDVQGCGNFYIKLVDENNIEKHRLIMYDSSHRDSDGNYISIGQDQVDWYKAVAQECYDMNIKHSLFGHIPFNNLSVVINDGESLTGDDNFNGIGEIWSDMGNNNDKMFNAVKESKSCTLIVAGHMHNIDIAKYYEGICYKMTRAGGKYLNINDNQLHGVAEITIIPNANTTKEMYSFNTLTY